MKRGVGSVLLHVVRTHSQEFVSWRMHHSNRPTYMYSTVRAGT